ncbi:FAD dependent oxidoreductase [Legionella moravica]|uniref:FAD dependent oxidoreductase n=1 Tax=Legionella moravica TaxID=39962 RepID=A0A378JYU5_9GAMM|nr:FAD-binding oxidoreductase [Legionella moravica]KTD31166.1 FAD dependent oxidoreductase [Legionella moravica]STX63210.1 FAD dependent oxidoreductase [Legionella moravica]
MHDIIIIGGGIAGLSLAYRCMGSNKVLLIEQNDFFSGTTSQSLAGFSLSYSSELFTPYLHECLQFYTNLNPDIIKPRGRLISSLLPVDERDYKDFIPLSSPNALSDYGFDFKTVEAIKSLIDFHPFQSFYYEKNYFDLEIECIKKELLTALQRCKNTFLHPFERVVHIKTQNKVWQIETTSTTYNTPIVINASGPWTNQLFNTPHIHLQREDCALIGFDGLEDDAQFIPAITDDSMSFFIKPSVHHPNEFIVASNTTKTSLTTLRTPAFPDRQAVAKLLDRLKQVTFPTPKLKTTWVGIKTISEDTLPLIGFDGNKEGLFWFTGFAGYGNKLAPLFSQLAFDLIMQTDSAKKDIVNKLSPNRYFPSHK